jgi:CarD family transcriptional regulator
MTMTMTKSALEFTVADYVVYPAHGVGQVKTGRDPGSRRNLARSLRHHLRPREDDAPCPTKKAKTAGLRPLASGEVVTQALTTLKGRARVKRTMWSRRAQEYEAKINSGDLISIAEVVRDLYRADSQPEQSYSERQLYESALDRMAREVAAVEQIDRDSAVALLAEEPDQGRRRLSRL